MAGEAALQGVASALTEGALVVFPTETVYGVGASAIHPDAVARLRRIKGRTDGRPFSVHLGSPAAARDYVERPSAVLRRFVRKAWPGPLTLIAQTDAAATRVAQRCPPGQLAEIFHEDTVGLRCPDHRVAERILSAAAAPVVASSANLAGRPPPRDVEEAMSELGHEVDYVVDGGRARFATASTIVEVRGNDWRIVRAGGIDERTLRRMERSDIVFVCSGNSCRSPMAAALFRRALAERLGVAPEQLEAGGISVTSAGTAAAAGLPASRGAMEEMERRGLSLADHRSRGVTVELLLGAERIYVMTPEHRGSLLELAPGLSHKVELLDPEQRISDPVGGPAEVYTRCADQIERAVLRRAEECFHEHRDW